MIKYPDNLRIYCPYCSLGRQFNSVEDYQESRTILKKEDILPHFANVHGMPSTSLHNRIEALKTLGLYEEAPEDAEVPGLLP